MTSPFRNVRPVQVAAGAAGGNVDQQQQINELTQRLQDLHQQYQQQQQQNVATQQQLQQLLQQQQNVAGDQAAAAAPAGPTMKAPYSGKPPPFCLQNDKTSFKIWKEKWSSFQISSGLNLITDPDRAREAKKAALSAALSNDSIRWVHSNTNLTEIQKTDADEVIRELELYIRRSVNPVVNTLKMLQRKQRSGESVDDFTTDLQDLVEACCIDDITDTKDWFLKICLISNIENTETRAKLMLEPALTYNEMKALSVAEENASRHSRQVLDPSNPEVNKMSQYKNTKKFGDRNESRNENPNRGRSQNRSGRSDSRFQGRNETNCPRCGYKNHGTRTCPAVGQQCKSCKKFGHYAKVCRNRNDSGSVNMLKAKFFSLHVNSTQVEPLENVEIVLNSGKFDFRVEALPDSGSNLNAIGVKDLEFLGEDLHNLLPSQHRPTAADGHAIGTVGIVDNVEVTLGNVTMMADFYVLENLEKPILSREALKKLKLIPNKFPFVSVNHIEEKKEEKEQTEKKENQKKEKEKKRK